VAIEPPSPSPGNSRGNPRSGPPGSDDGGIRRTLPHVVILFGVDTGWRVPEVEWFAFSSSAKSSLGSVVPVLDVS
jgi:hypothetical protein